MTRAKASLDPATETSGDKPSVEANDPDRCPQCGAPAKAGFGTLGTGGYGPYRTCSGIDWPRCDWIARGTGRWQRPKATR